MPTEKVSVEYEESPIIEIAPSSNRSFFISKFVDDH